MAPLALTIASLRLLPGCSAGLNERTAIVEIDVEGEVAPGGFDRIRAGAPSVCPDEPLHGVADGDWPAAFLTESVRADAVHELAEWIVALTIAVQRWGRDPVWRGRVVAADSHRLTLAIPWRRERLVTDGLQFAVLLISAWGQPYPDPDRVRNLLSMFRGNLESIQAGGLPPNTLRFLQAASLGRGAHRSIPFDVLPTCVQLGWGREAERMDSSFTGRTGFIATVTARNKLQTRLVLEGARLPVPPGRLVTDVSDAVRFAEETGWPVVVKPLNQDQGVGVTPGIGDEVTLAHAFASADRLSPGAVIIEKHVAGDDHRLLVVGGRLLAAARRTPGGIYGDGRHTIEKLVERLNADPRRGDSPRSLLRRVSLDAEALDCLLEQGIRIESVPESGRWIPLRRTANISTGGSAVDVTAEVHPDNRRLAERAAAIVGLDIAGVDFLTADISRSWREVGGAICEVNAQPGFRPHWIADPDRDINGEIIDIMFAGRTGRIPTAAITGTNGKTTTAQMLHHIWTAAGAFAGVCTTAQVRIGDEVVTTDNMSGYPGAVMILLDPAVDAAVLEMPRKGLIMFGHPCDRYDVAALLNVTDDHIGVDGVETLEQMAELKAEVLERATGAVVVNAEDPLCMAMRSRAGTDRHILVARDPAAVTAHRVGGGEAVTFAERDGCRWIVACQGDTETPVIPVSDIPAAMNGLLRFNESNAMFAAALAWAQGIEVEVIRRALSSFHNTAEQNPGRYNVIDGLDFDVVLDYAHNPAGVNEICAVAGALPVTGRRLLCCLTVGNLHPHHFTEVAPKLAESFDEFVVGCVPAAIERAGSYPGEDPVATMLSTGRQALLDAGVPTERIAIEADPAEAVRKTLGAARSGDLVVLLAKHQHASPVLDEVIASQSRSPRR